MRYKHEYTNNEDQAIDFIDSLTAVISYAMQSVVNKDWSSDFYGESFDELSYIVENIVRLSNYADTLAVIPKDRINYMFSGDVNCLDKNSLKHIAQWLSAAEKFSVLRDDYEDAVD